MVYGVLLGSALVFFMIQFLWTVDEIPACQLQTQFTAFLSKVLIDLAAAAILEVFFVRSGRDPFSCEKAAKITAGLVETGWF